MLFHSLMACCFAFLQDFEQDAFDFQQKVEDIDRRLGTVFIQAFDDASDLDHTFKVCHDETGSSGTACWGLGVTHNLFSCGAGRRVFADSFGSISALPIKAQTD